MQRLDHLLRWLPHHLCIETSVNSFALSTTEAEYIALSQALRDVLPIMFLIQVIRKKGFRVIANMPHVYCKALEDNSGALELARLPTLRPRTKHINTCFHHFLEHFRNGLIKIYLIWTKDQIAAVLTKAIPQNDVCEQCV